MSKKTYHFAVITKATMEHEQGAPRSTVHHSDLRLELSGNLDKSVYLDGKGLPRKESLKPISITLVLGLITNIRNGAEKGWWKDHEHIQWIIDALQKGFVAQADVDESTMEY